MLAAGVASTCVLLGLPVIVGGIAGEFGLDNIQRGWIASADMAGSALASLLVMCRIASLNWRSAARAAVALVIAGNLASIWATEFGTLLATRVLAGFGGGFILSIAFTGLCHSRQPERYFGLYVLAQLVLQVLLLASLPAVIARGGMSWVYGILAAGAVATGFLTAAFPSGLAAVVTAKHAIKDVDARGGVDESRSARATIALAGQAVYFVTVAALWGYYEGFGAASSLSLPQIGNALAISALAGIVGAVAVMFLGTHVSRSQAITAGALVSVAGSMLLIGGAGPLGYAISASLFNFAWNFSFPYQMGLLSRFDSQGSVAVTSLIVQLAGLALGPAVAAVLLRDADYDSILLASLAGYGFSLGLFLWSARG